MRNTTALTAILSILLPATALGWPPNRDFIPNGNVYSCGTCHDNPEGGGARNHFGEDFEAAGLQGWGPALAALDSDGDGFTNGEELLDPEGVWRWFGGAESPGDPAEVTNPADSTSFPIVVEEEPVEPEVAPVEPEEEPVEPEEAPEEEPVEPEEEPVEPAEQPIEPEEEPVEPEEEPVEPVEPEEGVEEPQDGTVEPEIRPEEEADVASCASVDVGSQCSVDLDCGPEGHCLAYLQGGYCTSDATELCCPDGAAAVNLEDGSSLCLKSCASDADCRRGDDRSQYCDDDNTCWGCEMPQANVGASCIMDSDCGEGGVCVRDAFGWSFGGGYCAVDAKSWCCPDGSVEVVLGEEADAPRWCLQGCADSSECRGNDGYACLPDVAACWPSPDNDSQPEPSNEEQGVTEPPMTVPEEAAPAANDELSPELDEATPAAGTTLDSRRDEAGGCTTAPSSKTSFWSLLRRR